MLTETFDRSEEIIRPEMIYGKRKKLCDICIITFSQHVIEYALQKYDCKKVISLESTGGSIPIYIMTYQEKELALYQSMIGAPAAGACLEEARCLTGASHYIMFGSCGCLHEEITAGKLIVPTQAYRDEGLSYHYVPAGDYLPLPSRAGGLVFRAEGYPVCHRKNLDDGWAIPRNAREYEQAKGGGLPDCRDGVRGASGGV